MRIIAEFSLERPGWRHPNRATAPIRPSGGQGSHASPLGLYAEDSTQLGSYGQSGPGAWITVYANSGHAFIAVAGIVMNTAWYAPVEPTVPDSGPRWQPVSTIPAQYTGDQYGGFVQRHPQGL